MYEPQVFFIRNLGSITPTEARRISFEESLQFETIHEDTYRNFGFELIYIEPGNVTERVQSIRAAIERGENSSAGQAVRCDHGFP